MDAHGPKPKPKTRYPHQAVPLMTPVHSQLQLKGLPSPIHDSLLSLIFLLPSVQISPNTIFRKPSHLLLVPLLYIASLTPQRKLATSLERTEMASSLSLSLPTFFSALPSKTHHRSQIQQLSFFPKKLPSVFIARSADNGAGASGLTVVEETVEVTDAPPKTVEEKRVEVKDKEHSLSSNGVAVENAEILTFRNPRWVGGTWDLTQFQKDGRTDWDGVIDAGKPVLHYGYDSC